MSDRDAAHDTMVERFWRNYFMDGPPRVAVIRQRFFRLLPANTRCKWCLAPFDGYSGALVKTIFQTYPSRFNALYCNVCDDFATKYQGGAEFPITILFADVRGSTTLAEKIGPKEFSALINRFYVETTHVLSHAGAMIEKLAGDEVTAIFASGLSGEDYPGRAVDAAKELLRVTGNADPDGPWVPIGIGIHTGEAFVGSVGKPGGFMEVAALGDVPNSAARLTSLAGPGEILASEDTMIAARIDTEGLELRELELKGRSEKMNAFVVRL